DPEHFQDPDHEYGLFAGVTYEAVCISYHQIYEQVDMMDSQRRSRRRCVFILCFVLVFPI
ncbi:hypothetical protein FA13DRAFT_1644906, partial [Coprinellus micaceus]